MVENDVDTLDRILADDLSYVHTTAAIDTKESFVSGIGSGRLNYESITPTPKTVRTNGDSAIVRGGAHVHVNGNHFSLEYTVVYVNNDGEWQMISWHATRVPD
jgi:ketosteroid isomerase-like protein